MRGGKLLVPLRIPELGPSLGKLVSGAERTGRGISLDAVRLRLVTRILNSAGEARRLAAREERSAALEAVGRSAWLEAWEEAVAQVSRLIIGHVRWALGVEARAVRMSQRRLRAMMPGDGEERTLAARLGSAGAPLITALDVLEACSSRALAAGPGQRDAVRVWQEALGTAARRLEASWLAMEDAVASEIARWDGVAKEIESWRRPLWPVAAAGGALMVAAVWLGLVLGGYVTPPDRFVDLWQAVASR